MVEGLHLLPRHRKEIVALLHKHIPGVEVWAYGSRVNGRSHDGSDLDLVLRGPKLAERDTSRIADFIEALQDSTIPFLVEARDWARLPESFHHEVEREHVVLVEREDRDVGHGWRKATLGELGEVNRGRSRHRPRNAQYLYGGPYPFVQTGAIKASGGRVTTHSQTYSEAGLAQSRLWPANTMVITIAANIAETAVLTYPACFPDSVIGFIADESKCDVRFVEYMFRFLKSKLQHENVGTGSVQDNINLQTLDQLRFLLPPLSEQRAIAHILGTLDDKIELNRRMNETLEAMARALFKSWFVDFNPVRAKMAGRDTGLPQHLADLFPDQLVESELGEIPEGWEVKALGECFNLTMGQSPPGSTYNEHDEGLPFFQGRSDFGFRYPENRKFCTSPTRIAQAGDTLVSVRAPVGDINMAWERCCIGRGVAALRHKSGSMSFSYYSTWTIQAVLRDYEHTGTVFGAINKSQFEALPVIEPDRHVVDTFNSCARVLDARTRSSTAEFRTLGFLRDTLLPKLVSGELAVQDAERLIGEAQS